MYTFLLKLFNGFPLLTKEHLRYITVMLQYTSCIVDASNLPISYSILLFWEMPSPVSKPSRMTPSLFKYILHLWICADCAEFSLLYMPIVFLHNYGHNYERKELLQIRKTIPVSPGFVIVATEEKS